MGQFTWLNGVFKAAYSEPITLQARWNWVWSVDSVRRSYDM